MSSDRIATLQAQVRQAEIHALELKAQLHEAIARDDTGSIAVRNAARLEGQRYRRLIERMSVTAEGVPA